MREVSKAEFFAFMNPRDVHPRPVTPLSGRFHTSRWEMRETRKVVGKATSDSHGVEPPKFYLED